MAGALVMRGSKHGSGSAADSVSPFGFASPSRLGFALYGNSDVCGSSLSRLLIVVNQSSQPLSFRTSESKLSRSRLQWVGGRKGIPVRAALRGAVFAWVGLHPADEHELIEVGVTDRPATPSYTTGHRVRIRWFGKSRFKGSLRQQGCCLG